MKIVENFDKLLEESIETYYWVGFLMADGYLTDRVLDLAIDKKDYEHLKKFAIFIEFESEIKEKRNMFRINFSNNIKELRLKFDFKDRKTYNPPIGLDIKNDNLFLAFFCGFIDGDGNIHKKINRKKKLSESCSLFIMCHSSWRNTLERWCKRVSEIINREDYIKKCNLTKRDECYIYLQDMKYLVQLKVKLIQIGLESIFLKRKWDKIDLEYSNKQFVLANKRIDIIKELHGKGMDKNEIAKCVGITESQVRKILSDLGIKTKRSSFKRKVWTQKELELLKKYYPICSGREINIYLPDRSYDAISKRYEKLRREEYDRAM